MKGQLAPICLPKGKDSGEQTQAGDSEYHPDFETCFTMACTTKHGQQCVTDSQWLWRRDSNHNIVTSPVNKYLVRKDMLITTQTWGNLNVSNQNIFTLRYSLIVCSNHHKERWFKKNKVAISQFGLRRKNFTVRQNQSGRVIRGFIDPFYLGSVSF